MDPLNEKALRSPTTLLAVCTNEYLARYPFLKTQEGATFARFLNNTTPKKIAQFHCEGIDFIKKYNEYRDLLRSRPDGDDAVGLLNEAIDKIYVWLQSNYHIDPSQFSGTGEFRIRADQADLNDPDSLGHGWMSLGGLYIHTLSEQQKKDLEDGKRGIGMSKIKDIIARLQTTDSFSAQSERHASSYDYACMLSKLGKVADPSFALPNANLKILTKLACQKFANDFSQAKYVKQSPWDEMWENDPAMFRTAAFEMIALQKYAVNFEDYLTNDAHNWVIVDDYAEFDVDMEQVRSTLDRAYQGMEEGIRYVQSRLYKFGTDEFDDTMRILANGFEHLSKDTNSIYSCRPVTP